MTTPQRNLSNTPALKAIYDASLAVEACGASDALTKAVVAVGDIQPHVHALLDRIDRLEAHIRKLVD